MKLVVLALLVVAALSQFHARSQIHDYWTTVGRTAAIKASDWAWGYCDYKCTYLEKYYNATDFVVLTFNTTGTLGQFKPLFSSCYIANANQTYSLWSSVAGSNNFFEKLCGGDSSDWWAQSTGSSPTYQVTKVEGAGIGTEISYT